MKVIDKTAMADGTKVQLEDWHENNTPDFPKLYGYTIGAYPVAKNTGKYGWGETGKPFRLTISRNEYRGYTDDMVLTDYEALKNGTKTLLDLREWFYCGKRDEFYLGLIDKEPEDEE